MDESEIEDLQQEQQQESNPTELDAEQEEQQAQEDEQIDESLDEVLQNDGMEEPTVETVEEEEEQQDETNEQEPVMRSTRTKSAVKHTTFDKSGAMHQKEHSDYQKMKDVKVEQQHNMSSIEASGHQCTAMEAMAIARAMGEINHHVTSGEQHAQQHAFEKGLRKFGEQGREAAIKEASQLVARSCFKPILSKDMTRDERRKAQRALVHLAQKRDKTIEGVNGVQWKTNA